MDNLSARNKKIAKNAAVLYFRMLITVLVGLYTSRVILQALGVEDYGIYNVVGGFVSMFHLISTSLSSAISRFLTYELGRNDLEKIHKVFSTSIFVLIGLSFIIFISTETFGLWYLHNKLVIPSNRIIAASWVFQISILTFIISLLNSPYRATLVAHEQMNIFAYLSILNVTCKLIISYLVFISPFDKLIFYAILLCFVTLIDQVLYVWYCKKKYEECHFRFIFDRNLFKEMFGFAGWNFIGVSADILRTQGASLLLNAFGGPLVNAANGIANTICGVVLGFVRSFSQAFNPQIIKRYASHEYNSLMTLIFYGAKFSYFILFIIALPVIINIKLILQLWLGFVPEHTVIFSRLVFVYLLSETISRPIIVAKLATGKIRNYQIVVGGILLLMLPLSYFCLKLGAPIYIVYICNIFTSILAIFARLFMLKGDIPLWSSSLFMKKVFVNVIIVSIIASIPPLLLYVNLDEKWTRFISTTFIAFMSTSLSIYFIGCNKEERVFIHSRGKSAIRRIKRKFGE